MRLIIVQAQRALVGSLFEVVFVCLSVTGLRLKYTGLRIVYVSCSMCPLFFTLALVLEDALEDIRWRQARERMQRYRKQLSGMKDGSAKVKREDLRANTNATHFARWPGVNGIGKEQHDTIVCTTLHHILSRQPATFHVLCVRHILRMQNHTSQHFVQNWMQCMSNKWTTLKKGIGLDVLWQHPCGT